MAVASTEPVSDPCKRLIRRALAALRRGIETHARHMSRRDRIEALEARSDAELARMGLRREDIAIHVYRDLFYA